MSPSAFRFFAKNHWNWDLLIAKLHITGYFSLDFCMLLISIYIYIDIHWNIGFFQWKRMFDLFRFRSSWYIDIFRTYWVSGWWFGAFICPFSWECHHHWRNHSYFSEGLVETTNQIGISIYLYVYTIYTYIYIYVNRCFQDGVHKIAFSCLKKVAEVYGLW